MEKISWTNQVKKKEILHRIKEERNFLLKIKRMKANLIRYMLHRNCLLKHLIEGKGRRGKRHKQLQDDLKEARRYWNLEEEALACTL
jgi:hypothetical protein